MDPKNTFHTAGTYRLMRAEHLAILAVCIVLGVMHFEEVRWLRGFIAFWAIDIVGYLPGAIAYRRQGGGPIPAIYHHIYNLAHTYLVVGLGVGIWALAIGKLEWAMLAVVVHLSIDRGVFGNLFKPLALEFEPVPAPDSVVSHALGRAESRTSKRVPLDDASEAVDHPSGFLALSPENQIYTRTGHAGFIAYREQGKHLVAFGGVHAPEEVRGELLDAFISEAARRHRRVMAVQVRENQVELFSERGFTVNPFGTSFALHLDEFRLGGKKKMKLRNKISRARRAGLKVLEIGQELPRDESTFDRIREVSAAWLADKGSKELEFMVGKIGDPGDTERRVFLAIDENQVPVGFISYVPVWGERPGLLHDLTRRKPTAPVGTMELLNSVALERFREEGVAFLHFGFTPFVVNGHEAPTSSKLVSWAIHKLRQHGKAIYPAESQADYKLKWEPDVVEQEYLAVKPLSLRGVVDLLLVTRSV